jgi:branched-chain amino acid transport system permease protein
LSLLVIAACLAAGGLIGFMGGALGIGGGLIAIPALVLLMGMSQQLAQGTALIMVLPTIMMAVRKYNQQVRIDKRVALAGAAGGLYGTVSQINPYIGATLTAKCFAISIIGGLDNPLGVMVGGLFLGIVESLTTLYVGPTFADVASFGILVLVLFLRPSGLLGRAA